MASPHFEVGVSRPHPNCADLAAEIRDRTIHYGDPPRGKGCRDGDANSVPIRVLQYWRKEGQTWVRDPSLEIDVLDPNNEGYRDPARFGKPPADT